jgi:hypothetical protein
MSPNGPSESLYTRYGSWGLQSHKQPMAWLSIRGKSNFKPYSRCDGYWDQQFAASSARAESPDHQNTNCREATG